MGAAVNISSRSWNHATSLHFCSQLGKMENLKLLLKHGANVFLKDRCGHTARDRAQKHPECEKILQEQEGKIQNPDNFAMCFYHNINFLGRCTVLMVSALVSGLSSSGLSPGRGRCVVFLGKTLNSHSASFHPDVLMSTGELNPLSPGTFCKRSVFWTFWWFLGWMLAKLPLIRSKTRLQQNSLPFLPPALRFSAL